MSYTIDRVEIETLAQKHKDDFEVMYYQLTLDDDVDDSKLDHLVEQLSNPIVEAIDCTACGRCCRALDVYLEHTDVARLANGLERTTEQIQEQYVMPDIDDKLAGECGKFKMKPCTFLNGNLCTVYEHRPQSCRDYPYFTPDFRWWLKDMIEGASLCPIICHVLIEMLGHVDHIGRGEYK